jgi:hypothetical protein
MAQSIFHLIEPVEFVVAKNGVVEGAGMMPESQSSLLSLEMLPKV